MKLGIGIGIPSTSGGTSLDGIISALFPAAHWAPKRFPGDVTVTGLGASSVLDRSGNSNALLQGTDAKRPALQGDGTILFNGTSHFLKCNAFTLVQPETIYLVFKQVSWTDADHICNGDSANVALFQSGFTPRLSMFAGSSTGNNTNLAVGTYGVVAAVFNGASSLTQVNNTAPSTGNAGASNPGGFTLGANNGGGGAWSNIQFAEGIVFPQAHDAATRAMLISALLSAHGLA